MIRLEGVVRWWVGRRLGLTDIEPAVWLGGRLSRRHRQIVPTHALLQTNPQAVDTACYSRCGFLMVDTACMFETRSDKIRKGLKDPLQKNDHT